MEAYVISLVSLLVTVLINVAIISWKFSNVFSRIKELEEKNKDNKIDMKDFDKKIDCLTTKIEVTNNSLSLISSQLTDLLGKQEQRIEKVEDSMVSTLSELAEHRQCLYRQKTK